MKKKVWLILVLAGMVFACKEDPDPQPTPTPPVKESGPAVVEVGEVLPDWEEGWLDIHSINGGRGESFYYIFPDGTTMLVDAAGAPQNEYTADKDGFPSKPNVNVSCGRVIINYIKHFAPAVSGGKLDYFMASHYHGDHIGAWRNDWRTTYKWGYNDEGGFVINGLPEVGMDIPIVKIIDRGDWTDRVSADYFESGGKLRYQNYTKFVEWSAQKYGTVREAMQVGHDDQIVMTHDPGKYNGFSIRNIAASGRVWTGTGTQDASLMPSPEEMLKHASSSEWNVGENVYSCAFHLKYGSFDYFAGGDHQYNGRSTYAWKDIEAPMAKVMNKVEVMKAGHHGTGNTNSKEFLAVLKPDVFIAATWQDVQPNPETIKRVVTSNDKVMLFTTNMAPENLQLIQDSGTPASRFSATQGHIVVRVEPSKVRYWIFVLDDSNEQYKVKAKFGPLRAQ
ncbi:MAG: hypothetical protein IIU20_00615 [Bacteroidales bacterium]|nr:hypothetical protein [Bacteroidales bacterium]